MPLAVDRRSSAEPYRTTLVGKEWHVRRPHASISHAFDRLDQAESFVSDDNGGEEAVVEIIVGTAYMVKTLGTAR
jgi:hypothetical protein